MKNINNNYMLNLFINIVTLITVVSANVAIINGSIGHGDCNDIEPFTLNAEVGECTNFSTTTNQNISALVERTKGNIYNADIFETNNCTGAALVQHLNASDCEKGQTFLETVSVRASLSTLISKDTFQNMFSHRQFSSNCDRGSKLLTYEAFIAAADDYYPSFGNVGNLTTRIREVTAFLAQVSQETTGWWPGQKYYWGGCILEEFGCGDGCPQYSDFDDEEYPPVEGVSYHGLIINIRGNSEYGRLSEEVYANKSVLLNDPKLILKNSELAWRSSLWLWMSPQSKLKKPSSHDVMVGNANECPSVGRLFGFGWTTNLIKGGDLCNVPTSSKVEGRVNYYRRYVDILGESPGPNLYCDEMSNYFEVGQCSF